MNVLLTGAFGNIGVLVLDRLLDRGHRVTCFDIKTPVNVKVARAYEQQINLVWGDIRDAQCVEQAVVGQDAIIHMAAIIAPMSESKPELARQVNIGGTENLLNAMAAQPTAPLFVFTSSFAVYGFRQSDPPPRTVDEPLQATDHYSQHKIDGERMVQARASRWAILRLAGAVDSRMRHTSKEQAVFGFLLAADNRMEYIYPGDAATALVNVLDRPESHNRIHLIGGGKSCQIRHIDVMNAMTGAMGLTFKVSDFGTLPLYADWADTRESQRLLEFQQHSFADFRRELYDKYRWVRLIVRPISPLIKGLMKRWLNV